MFFLVFITKSLNIFFSINSKEKLIKESKESLAKKRERNVASRLGFRNDVNEDDDDDDNENEVSTTTTTYLHQTPIKKESYDNMNLIESSLLLDDEDMSNEDMMRKINVNHRRIVMRSPFSMPSFTRLYRLRVYTL